MILPETRPVENQPVPLDSDHWLEAVRQQVSTLQFGIVQIVVHNARVTQVDRTERVRLDPPPLLHIANPPNRRRE